jgi:squalene-hopene/tetraprenyl-beta-curcumene cyclase
MKVFLVAPLSVALLLALLPRTGEAQEGRFVAAEWDKAAAANYLDERAEWWTNWSGAARDRETACVSCHTTLPYALARPRLRASLDEPVATQAEARIVADVVKRVELWNEVGPFYPDQTLGLPKTSESRGTEAVLNALILATRDEDGGALTSESRRAFENLWALQFTRGEDAGSWAWLNFGLAPWESDGAAYFGAALAAVAVGRAPDEYSSLPHVRERVTLLRAYLQKDAANRTSLDRVMALWASVNVGEVLTERQKQSLLSDLAALQNPDGGWTLSSLGSWQRLDGSLPARESDAYATGLIAFVLLEAGVASDDEDLSAALLWLAQSQNSATGTWNASSLNKDRDPESDRGRFMSDAATAFAVLALDRAESPNR